MKTDKELWIQVFSETTPTADGDRHAADVADYALQQAKLRFDDRDLKDGPDARFEAGYEQGKADTEKDKEKEILWSYHAGAREALILADWMLGGKGASNETLNKIKEMAEQDCNAGRIGGLMERANAIRDKQDPPEEDDHTEEKEGSSHYIFDNPTPVKDFADEQVARFIREALEMNELLEGLKIIVETPDAVPQRTLSLVRGDGKHLDITHINLIQVSTIAHWAVEAARKLQGDT